MKRILLLISMMAVMASAGARTLRQSADTLGSERQKGKYVWVPDSMINDVRSVLSGERKGEKNDSSALVRRMPVKSKTKKVWDSESLDMQDPDEKVLYHGDTIPMVLRDRNFGRYDRGLFNYLFIPKGQWHFGLTASYGEFNTDDLEVLDLIKDVDLSAHSFSIRPYISYFIRNNMSVGFRLGYTSTKANVNNFSVDIDDDINFALHDIMYRNESYTAAVTLDQYFGITRRGRFGVFNEVELAFSSGNGDFRRPFNGEPKNTHTTYMDARLNFSPGVCVFIMKNVSFNLSFGVFGFYLRNEKQWVNDEESGNRFTSGANFRFNIFNINFGLGIHI